MLVNVHTINHLNARVNVQSTQGYQKFEPFSKTFKLRFCFDHWSWHPKCGRHVALDVQRTALPFLCRSSFTLRDFRYINLIRLLKLSRDVVGRGVHRSVKDLTMSLSSPSNGMDSEESRASLTQNFIVCRQLFV